MEKNVKNNGNTSKTKKKLTIKEQWTTSIQTRALLKLKMWGIFFASSFIILAILTAVSNFRKDNLPQRNAEEVKNEEKVEVNVPSLLQKLLDANYSFEYTINNDGTSVYYTGTKYENEIKGFYENSGNIIRYEVVDNIYYKVENQELVEDSSIITEEDKQTININELIVKLKEYEENNEPVVENDNYTYDFSDETNSYIVIVTKESETLKIEIKQNNKEYILKYVLGNLNMTTND